MSFDLIRRGGPWTHDPRDLPRYSVPVANLVRSSAAGGVSASSTNDFFTGTSNAINQDAGSVILNKAWNTWAADTYYTLVSVASGSGFLANVIGPCPDGAQTNTFRITADGVVYTIPVACGAASERAVIGYLMPRDAYRGTDNYGFSNTAASTDGLTTRLTANHAVVLGAHDPRVPFLLRFNSSLLVEAKLSVAALSGGIDYSAVVMRRFT